MCGDDIRISTPDFSSIVAYEVTNGTVEPTILLQRRENWKHKQCNPFEPLLRGISWVLLDSILSEGISESIESLDSIPFERPMSSSGLRYAGRLLADEKSILVISVQFQESFYYDSSL